ncbi:MAG: DNA primase [Hyphomonadaceae bacterium]
MRFSDSFLRTLKDRASIAAYAGKFLQWDRRKSQPAKGDYWAPCPFHSEKTASFHVRDSQGSYKCFGCGEGGGVLDLAMKLEGLSFPEAVERLAAFAGLTLPVDESPRDEEEERRRKRLYGVLARAQEWFRQQLAAPAGGEARAYLERRGLTAAVQDQVGIGYAPGGWTAGLDALKAAGFTPEEMIAAGLVSPGDGDRRAIDVFRNRVMFPIADAQGRIIAFGGRALDPEAKAKYLNSPDTPLFHKGQNLYRLKEARTLLARSKAAGLVVAEGYVDVIAFERAGIAAVAPLGTALTEDQLQLVWRAGGEPVLCFDGDGAGGRAAGRALDLALPHLAPGRTVRVALLADGADPDDLFRAQGAAALARVVEAARPAADALFERERDRAPLDTPERKSAFKKALREAASRIADADTRSLYLAELLARADAHLRSGAPAGPGGFRPRPPGRFVPGRNGGRFEPEPRATAELKARQAGGGRRFLATENFLREAVDRPHLAEQFADWIAKLPIADADLDAIRHALLDLMDASPGQAVDRAALNRHLVLLMQERAAARVSAWPPAGAGPRADEAAAEAEWMALVTLEMVLPALKEEMAALRAQADQGDAGAFERFLMLDRDARTIEADFRARRASRA